MSDLTPDETSKFIALRNALLKASRNIEPGTDFQKGAISMANDVVDMIGRILKDEK